MSSDTTSLPGSEGLELQKTFAALAPLMQGAENGEDAAAKRHKPNHHRQPEEGDQTKALVNLLASMVLRLDQETQQMRKQDSFVFYMQMEKEGVIHDLLKEGKQWHQSLQNPGQMQVGDRKPLRAALAQKMVAVLKCRLEKLSQCQPQDAFFQAAVATGIINMAGEFSHHRWDATQKNLSTTDHAPVPMNRMIRYVQQLEELFQERDSLLKFHALRAPQGSQVTPWMMQVSLRMDDLHVLMCTLSGSKLWTLLGVSVKPHNMNQSPQGLKLQEMMGKGVGKHRGKGKKPAA